MSVKIFVSSVWKDLANHRTALENEIKSFEDIFIGMEYFGTVSESPAEYCIERVRSSHLFVGIIGQTYGSIEGSRNKSFTEIEYDTAVEYAIPCLIYLQRELPDYPTDARQRDFRARLQKEKIVSWFSDEAELCHKFLHDFIRCLRGDLANQFSPRRPPTIPIEPFRAFSKEFLAESIKAVAQDKYLSALYVEREQEKVISHFIEFDKHFQARLENIIDILGHILKKFNRLNITELRLNSIASELRHIDNIFDANSLINELDTAFLTRESRDITEQIHQYLLEENQYVWQQLLAKIKVSLSRLRYLSDIDLSVLSDAILNLKREITARGFRIDYSLTAWNDVYAFLPAWYQNKEWYLSYNLLAELRSLVNKHGQRCLALVARAGRGKTNLVCHLASQLVDRYPVIVFSGQSTIDPTHGIEWHVQQQLESQFRDLFPDWMNRLSPTLRNSASWLFLIIDGINENIEPTQYARCISRFLAIASNRRIKLIVTCRDIYWERFETDLEQYLFDGKTIGLDAFNDDEWNNALKKYFNYFDIQGTPSSEARQALKNPLLLRFFCEANRGHVVATVTDLSLFATFNCYLNRVSRTIGDRLNLRKEAVIDFLCEIGHLIWTNRQVEVSFDDLHLDLVTVNNLNSLYNLIRDENIILEEQSGSYKLNGNIRFVYDEFMEYILAYAWLRKMEAAKSVAQSPEAIINEAVSSIEQFPNGFSAIPYLDQMLSFNGKLVNQAIAKIGAADDKVFSAHQFALLQSFENMSIVAANEQVLSVLDRLERTARDDVKLRLGQILIQVQVVWRDHPIVQDIVRRILEVSNNDSYEQGLPATMDRNPDLGAVKTKLKRLKAYFNNSKLNNFYFKLRRLKAYFNNSKLNNFFFKEWKAENNSSTVLAGRLPPARFHYPEETKLNAIALLVSSNHEQAHELAKSAIERLGRTDLHSALDALAHLDSQDDATVLRILPEFIDGRGEEYRIFAAWLLRKRFGSRFANYLEKLLCDPSSRVYRFTMRLFDDRAIEEELVLAILKSLHRVDLIKNWHLVNYIHLLGRRRSFQTFDIKTKLATTIVECLMTLTKHDSATVRLEAFRALTAWPEFLDVAQLVETLHSQQDPYLRSFALKFKELCLLSAR